MRLLAFVVLISSSALAQAIAGLHDEQWVTSRTFATVGVVIRQSSQEYSGGPSVLITGGGPRLLAMHVSGAVFPRKYFGMGFGLRSDFVGANQEGQATTALPQQTVHGYATAALRWQPTILFGLEGHLGWFGGRAALIFPSSPPTFDFPAMTGPVLGATFVFDPTARFTAQVSGRLEYSLTQLTGFGFALGVQARYGLVDLGPFELGLAATVELNGGEWRGANVTKLNDGGLRFAIGPSLVSRRAAPPSVETPATAPSLIGAVTRADGAPVSGATVTAGDRTATTDSAGTFTLDGLPPGPVTVAASAPSLRPASKPVVITPGVSVEVTLVLEAKTGPGSISGTVRAAPDKPLAGARVTSGATTVTTSATGQYSLSKMGPGAVKVRVTLDGYTPANEVVQVAPEANATLDLTLELATQRSKAKIRGVVSSAAGPVASATVRIVELKLKQSVKADGRFEAEVLGGRYTLVIEAAKHVTQTRVVEVADGDQAIFQIELEKVR